MQKRSILAALAAVAVTATTVYASVTYDPATGGFAGKGDVKEALGLNENQIRAQAEALVFTYVDEAEYDVPCMKENAAQILRNTFQRERSVNATVAFEARKNSQGVLTGFILDAAGDVVGGDNVECPGGWEADGEPVLISSVGGGLLVNGIALPNTP